MGLWSWLFRPPKPEAEEVWTMKRYVPHQLRCCVCSHMFRPNEIILASNRGRFKHRGC